MALAPGDSDLDMISIMMAALPVLEEVFNATLQIEEIFRGDFAFSGTR